MICRTWIESVNNLFDMGKDLETEVDGIKSGVVSNVTLTEVDKHYTLTLYYEDGTHDTVNWDDSTVGIEDITLTFIDGVYVLRITLEDGTVYSFTIPVGDIVTEQELTALNLGTPDDSASATGSLWARVKNAVSRIVTLETADGNNVKKTGTSVVTGDIQVPTPAGDTSVISKGWVDTVSDNNNLLHKSGSEIINGVKTIDNGNTFSRIQLSSARTVGNLGGYCFNRRVYDGDTYIYKLNGAVVSNEQSTYRSVRILVYDDNEVEKGNITCVFDAQNNIAYCTCISRTVPTNPSTTYDNDIVTVKTLRNLGLI